MFSSVLTFPKMITLRSRVRICREEHSGEAPAGSGGCLAEEKEPSTAEVYEYGFAFMGRKCPRDVCRGCISPGAGGHTRCPLRNGLRNRNRTRSRWFASFGGVVRPLRRLDLVASSPWEMIRRVIIRCFTVWAVWAPLTVHPTNHALLVKDSHTSRYSSASDSMRAHGPRVYLLTTKTVVGHATRGRE